MDGLGATTTLPWSPIYLPALATPITTETLATLRSLIVWVLQREQTIQTGSEPSSAPEALRQQLAALQPATLLQGIQRHRLESFLQADPAVSDLLRDLRIDLQRAARREAMAALALASLTREMALLFGEVGIPLLVLKGIPLALQTTSSLTARGRGDLDLLVDPSRLVPAIALLESRGFERVSGKIPRNLVGPSGRYSRWVGYELSLVRVSSCGRREWIDLHWALSNVRAPVPTFQKAWAARDLVKINQQWIPTLARRHAFQHGCAHAAKDGWGSLRQLVDLQRLSVQLGEGELQDQRRWRPVALSLTVIETLFATEPSASTERPQQQNNWVSRRALQAQLSATSHWDASPHGWSAKTWWSRWCLLAALSTDWRDWLRLFLNSVLGPEHFCNPLTGCDQGLRMAFVTRLKRLPFMR